MGKKKATRIEQSRELAAELLKDYRAWKSIYEGGGSDPGWPDGMGLFLKRNHIIAGKHQIEDLLGDDWMSCPDCFFFPLPPEMPRDFMAARRPLPLNYCDLPGEEGPEGRFHAFATPGKKPYGAIMAGRSLDDYLREAAKEGRLGE
jgi:hypothetical protein